MLNFQGCVFERSLEMRIFFFLVREPENVFRHDLDHLL